MEAHYVLTDREFEEKFQDCRLDPAIFSHEAHIRLAWIHIQQYGIDQAIAYICTQLPRFVEHIGAADKYNKTLTIAAIKAVYHFIKRGQSHNFYDFIHEFPRLKNNFMELMRAHYSQDIFTLPSAKKTFVEPDLLPFT